MLRCRCRSSTALSLPVLTAFGDRRSVTGAVTTEAACLRVRIGHPWAANDISEPEPDVAIVRLAEFAYPAAPSTALLLIEVARSSRRTDLGTRARIYATAGVPAYWVVDLRDELVHVHSEPTDLGYDRVDQVGFAATLDAAGVPVRIADLLGDP